MRNFYFNIETVIQNKIANQTKNNSICKNKSKKKNYFEENQEDQVKTRIFFKVDNMNKLYKKLFYIIFFRLNSYLNF